LFITTGQFIHDALPSLMRGKTGFSVLLATYNDAGDIVAGVPIPAGLRITTRTGNLVYSVREPVGRFDEPVPRQMECQAAVAQAAVSSATDREAYDLAVVYLGLTGFDRALSYALRLHRDKTATTVAVLTCDCDKQEKEKKLRRHVDAGDISMALITKACGGQADLPDIHLGLQEIWPQCKLR